MVRGASLASVRSRDLSARQWTLVVTPPALLTTMYLTFDRFVALFGFPRGYVYAFVVYWVGWCIVLPVALLGPTGVIDRFGEPNPRLGPRPRKTALLLLWPIAFPLVFVFVPQMGDATLVDLVASVLVGLVIGVTEEVLWRGTYVSLFPENDLLGYYYPAIWFGLWHFAPQSAHTSAFPGAPYSFVLYALALGLSYGYYAYRTGSIRWCTVSHVVHDSLGLAGPTFLLLAQFPP
jgi:membrane protease YdiL (CAAX protease family)